MSWSTNAPKAYPSNGSWARSAGGWSKDPKAGGRLINARTESITQKPSFRKAAAKQRCVLPADGYYEWEAGPNGKQPYFLHLEDQILNMAGLYELWRDESKDEKDPARWLWSATAVTTAVILSRNSQ